MNTDELFAARQRVDQSGAAMMSTGSVALLVKLACGSGKWTAWKILSPFLAASHINELDLQPLIEKGWVESKNGTTGALVIRITDEGNATVRALVSWLALHASSAKVTEHKEVAS
jgi:hypothetical protein